MIQRKRAQIVLTPEGDEYHNHEVYLPCLHTVQGRVYYVDPASTVRDDQGCVSEDMIPVLQKKFTDVLNRPCTIDTESSLLYVVSDCGIVYEVDMFNAHRRFLREMLPNGQPGDLFHIVGAIFCPEHFCFKKENAS